MTAPLSIRITMSKFSYPALRAALILAASPVLPALANDGTIVITGSISDQTCVIEEPSTLNHIKVVQLPKISKNALRNDGDTAGATPFDIKLKECPQALGALKLYFEPGITTNYDTGDLIAYKQTYNASGNGNLSTVSSATKAKGVEFRLANLNGQHIRMGTDKTTQAAQTFTGKVTNGSKSYTLRYLASYVKKPKEDVDAAQITSYVGFSVVYP
ncbi:serotype 3 fimbrial subunit [Bordetella pertussis]|nr:serotype 3 fimbrial subunit [Bordetella pertussis]CFP46959.1 serotype 3 fimbrial subunit [Bordetella pertussis]CPK29436.1 serotype 3 fimbrial subunit [Bordetella pertussis]CPL34820.1 serotype 3 fimbrial subunit [Bordetella pertussis]CPL66509.1 serotype 3 fimbrial subunit [Bordetella pertussis]